MIEGEESPLGTAALLAILRAGTPDTLTVFRETGYRRRFRQHEGRAPPPLDIHTGVHRSVIQAR
jgi:hypothetical protein